MAQNIAEELQKILDTKNSLKYVIYNICSDEHINDSAFADYQEFLKSLPFLYDPDKIQGDIVAVYNKDNTDFNLQNTSNVKYYPVGGDTNLNNSNRVIAYSGLDLDNLNNNVLNFESLLDYSSVPNSITLNYSEAFGSSVQFSTIAKKLTLNIDPNKALATPTWEVKDCSNLEYLKVGELYFPRASESITKTLFQNLPKLTYLSFSGAVDTLPKLSTLYADCPKLETVKINLTPSDIPESLEQLENKVIINHSVDTLHLTINSKDSNSYLGCIIKYSDITINKLILESNNYNGSKITVYLYPVNTIEQSPALHSVKDIEIVEGFDCSLMLGEFKSEIINKLPEILKNLKYNEGNREDRYVAIHPLAEAYYTSEILSQIQLIVEEKNWYYGEP